MPHVGTQTSWLLRPAERPQTAREPDLPRAPPENGVMSLASSTLVMTIYLPEPGGQHWAGGQLRRTGGVVGRPEGSSSHLLKEQGV